MTEKLMVDRACFERGCMGLPNPHERLIKEDEVVWLVEGKEWVGLTDIDLEYLSNKKLGAYDLCLEVEAMLKERNT